MEIDLGKELKINKGLVSSLLGKTLGQGVLDGNLQILKDAVKLISSEDKNVRSGAAKIIETVAESKPKLLVDYLDLLFPALSVPEPQTRWMIIHVYGLCAKDNPKSAIKALPFMDTYISKESGTCLLARSIDYLGYVGALAKEYAKKSIIYLEKASHIDTNLDKRVLISFGIILESCDKEIKETILNILISYTKSEKEAVAKLAKQIIKKQNKNI